MVNRTAMFQSTEASTYSKIKSSIINLFWVVSKQRPVGTLSDHVSILSWTPNVHCCLIVCLEELNENFCKIFFICFRCLRPTISSVFYIYLIFSHINILKIYINKSYNNCFCPWNILAWQISPNGGAIPS